MMSTDPTLFRHVTVSGQILFRVAGESWGKARITIGTRFGPRHAPVQNVKAYYCKGKQ